MALFQVFRRIPYDLSVAYSNDLRTKALDYLARASRCLLNTAYAKEYEERSILSPPKQIATLNTEPEFLVGGLVSPLSGQPVLRHTDMVIRGAQDIVLRRTYIPPYPVRDIEFTDHGRPQDHPNPHQHVPKPNGTGGTPERGGAEPIPGWNYQ